MLSQLCAYVDGERTRENIAVSTSCYVSQYLPAVPALLTPKHGFSPYKKHYSLCQQRYPGSEKGFFNDPGGLNLP